MNILSFYQYTRIANVSMDHLALLPMYGAIPWFIIKYKSSFIHFLMIVWNIFTLVHWLCIQYYYIDLSLCFSHSIHCGVLLFIKHENINHHSLIMINPSYNIKSPLSKGWRIERVSLRLQNAFRDNYMDSKFSKQIRRYLINDWCTVFVSCCVTG